MSEPLDPQPGEIWSTSRGRAVEILARDVVYQPEGEWSISHETDTVAYRFLGGTMVHMRSVGSMTLWTRTEFE